MNLTEFKNGQILMAEQLNNLVEQVNTKTEEVEKVNKLITSTLQKINNLPTINQEVIVEAQEKYKELNKTLKTLYNDYQARIEEMREVREDILDTIDKYSEIESKIDSLNSESSNNWIKLYYPSGNETAMGNCTIVQGGWGFGLIDLGVSSERATLYTLLKTLLGTTEKLKFVAITHYHSDHMGVSPNAEEGHYTTGLNVLTQYINTKTTFYLPHGNPGKSSSFWDNVKSYENVNLCKSIQEKTIEWITAKGCTYIVPTQEDQTINLDNNTSLHFFNVTQNKFNTYQGKTDLVQWNGTLGSGNYNNFSMIIVIKVQKNTMIFPGDIMYEAQGQNLDALKYGCTVYMVQNHGLNYCDNNTWVSQLRPKYVIAMAFEKWNEKTYLNQSNILKSATAHWLSTGSTFFNTLNKNSIALYMSKGYWKVVTGTPYLIPNRSPLYVGELMSPQVLPNSMLTEQSGVSKVDLDKILMPGVYYTCYKDNTQLLINGPWNTSSCPDTCKLTVQDLNNGWSMLQTASYYTKTSTSITYIEYKRIINLNEDGSISGKSNWKKINLS